MDNDTEYLVVECPNPDCGKRLRVRAELAGKKVRCPGPTCRTIISVPFPGATEESAEIDEDDRPRRQRPVGEDDDEDEASFRRRQGDSEGHRPRRRRPADDDENEGERSRRRPVNEEDDEHEVARARRRRAEDDEDEDDEDETPRRPKGRKKRRRLRSGDSEELQQARKHASGLLFGIAAVWFVAVGIDTFTQNLPEGTRVLVIIEWLLVTMAFVGLGVWARFSPFPPTLLGLILYVGHSILVVALNPNAGLKVIVFRLFLTALLVKALIMSLKAR